MNLPFPEKVLLKHLAMLGMTGAGKSSALRVISEHLLERKKRTCHIDPKGDWWGLKVSADGEGKGFPVVMLGNFKEPKATDIPINEHAGKAVAELVASGNRPCVIGMRGWMPAAMTRFWIDFASTLFNTNASELFLIIDEVQNFAPKGKILSPQAAECIHWTNRLLAEGRGLGLTNLIASQRPQKVHNDTLTCCGTLVAMKVIHPADRKAIAEWLDGCGDKEQAKEILESLAGLGRGKAWVWSPEADFGPQKVEFPMFTTFDSFAPPNNRVHSAAGWSAKDIEAVKTKLEAVIQDAQKNDPKHLQARIKELEAKLAAKPAPVAAARVEVQVLVPDPKGVAFLQNASENLEKLGPVMEGVARAIAEVKRMLTTSAAGFAKGGPTPSAAPRAADVPAAHEFTRVQGQPAGQVSLTGGKHRIMVALAQFGPEPMTARRLSLLTNIARKGGTWRTYMAELRGANYVVGSDQIAATQAGVDALGGYAPLPTGEALRSNWRSTMGDSGKRKIFDAVCAVYPLAISADEVAEQTNIARAGGTWRTYMAELRGLELISGSDQLRACDDLFET